MDDVYVGPEDYKNGLEKGYFFKSLFKRFFVLTDFFNYFNFISFIML